VRAEAGSHRIARSGLPVPQKVASLVGGPGPTGFADLHLHSFFSDGTYSPEELCAHARRHGLRAVALTDHDTVEGCARTASVCEQAGVEFIPATELTTEVDGDEVHLLGYCIDPDHPRLLAELAKFQAVRQDRIREMVGRLNRLGIPLPAEAVFRLANCRSPGRPHVARALVQCGFCASLDEAFERFLKKSRPAWVPKFKISAVEAIELLHQTGGLAVLAHPGLTRSDVFIPQLAEAGLDGLECFHVKHSAPASARYVQVASALNLLVTGGSDCHGVSQGKPVMGTVKLAYAYVERLKARATERRLAMAGPLVAASSS
jgi:predicted metal-dependent phosphoesterase TrpH